MPDIKKFIAGFLVLAAAASSVVLIFTGYNSTRDRKAINENAAANVVSNVPKNAFAEPLAENNNDRFSVQVIEEDAASMEAKLDQPITYSTNLTENFALKFSREFVLNNPNGPTLDAEGNPTNINIPQEQAVIKAISGAITQVKSELMEKPSARIRVQEQYTKDDIAAYLDSTGRLAEKIITKLNFATRRLPAQTASAESAPDLRGVSDARKTFADAYNDLSDLAVPSPMEKLHTNALAYAEHQKKILGFTENYQGDPLKAYAAIKLSAKVLERDTKNLEGEMQRIAASGILNNIAFKENRTLFSFVSGLLGIRTAHAYFGGFAEDATTGIRTPTHIADLVKVIYEWLEKSLIGGLVKSILSNMFNGMLNWIKTGQGGQPFFITNWKSFLRDAGNQAVGLYIDNYVPNLCRNLQEGVRIGLNNYFLPTGGGPFAACTLDRLVANVENFYSSFSNGGWLAYGATTLPSGNYYGTMFMSAQQIAANKARNKEAAKNQGVAGRGFNPFRICPAGSALVSGSAGWAYPCKNAATGEALAAIDGTPGAAIAERLFKSEGMKPDRIVNAQRLTEIIGALLDAAITRLTKSIL